MHRKKLLLGFNLWDAEDRTRGLLWRGLGDPLCRQVREGTGVEAPRRPLRRFPGTYTGHPLYSVRKVRDLGMDSQNTGESLIPYSGPGGVLGTDQGKAVGATSLSWRGRLPMHLVARSRYFGLWIVSSMWRDGR
jgi:hypothetical protein